MILFYGFNLTFDKKFNKINNVKKLEQWKKYKQETFHFFFIIYFY